MCDGQNTTEKVSTGPSRRRLLGAGAAGLLATVAPFDSAVAASGKTVAAGPQGIQRRRPRFGLVTLGVQAGPPPSGRHFGISSALVVNGRTYVIDCGRGSVSQFYRSGLDINSLAAIFITHMHVDHTIDYIGYLQLCGGLPVPGEFHHTVDAYGPGTVHLGKPPKGVEWAARRTLGLSETTDLMMKSFSSSTNLFMREGIISTDRSELLHTHDIKIPKHVGASPANVAPRMRPFTVMEDDNVKVTAVLVPHALAFPSFAYRFDTEYGSVTFSGDTSVSTIQIRLAHRTDVLVHEAINIPFYEEAGVPEEVIIHHKESHTSITDVGAVARDAQARALVLSHYAPAEITNDVWTAQLEESCQRAAYTGRRLMAQDGQDVAIR